MRRKSTIRTAWLPLAVAASCCAGPRVSGIDTLDLDSGAVSGGDKARTIVVKGCVLGDPAGDVVAICGERRKTICLDATLNRERMRKGRKWFVESTVGRCGLFRGRMVDDRKGMRLLDLTPTLSQTLVRVDHRQESPCPGQEKEDR
jgi:hypothetical protein